MEFQDERTFSDREQEERTSRLSYLIPHPSALYVFPIKSTINPSIATRFQSLLCSWWSHRQRPGPHLKIETTPARDIARHLLSSFNIEPPNTILFSACQAYRQSLVNHYQKDGVTPDRMWFYSSVGYFPGVVGKCQAARGYVRRPNSNVDHT